LVDHTAIEIAIAGPRGDADASALLERVLALLEQHGARVVACDLAAVTAPDAGTVDELARLQLVVHAAGAELRLANASPLVWHLIRFCGLHEVLRGEENAY
jgi:anti-anti-sigma regulatory factor